MKLTLATVLNTTVVLGICVSFLTLLLNRIKWYEKLPVRIILAACIAVMFRFLMPLEFPFTISVYISEIWPHIYLFFRRPVCMIFETSVFLYQILLVLWILISLLLLLKLFWENMCLKRRISLLPDQNDLPVISLLHELNQQYNHSRNIRIAVSSDKNLPPYITGIRHPAIVLPDIEWNYQDLSFIFEHELIHFYRYHLHIKIACEIISILYFWNPFVYILKKEIFKLLEIVTDSIVTTDMSDEKKIAYAESMLNISRIQYLSSKSGIFFASHHESGLRQRIQILLCNKKHKKKSFICLFSIFILTMFLLNFAFVFESIYLPPGIESTTINMNGQNTVLVHRDNLYDVFYEGEYLTSVSEIFDFSIPIYEEE